MLTEKCSYYEIENTTGERSSWVSARWDSFDKAKKDIINYCDWYNHNGTGTIYKVTILTNECGEIKFVRECFCRCRGYEDVYQVKLKCCKKCPKWKNDENKKDGGYCTYSYDRMKCCFKENEIERGID